MGFSQSLKQTRGPALTESHAKLQQLHLWRVIPTQRKQRQSAIFEVLGDVAECADRKRGRLQVTAINGKKTANNSIDRQ